MTDAGRRAEVYKKLDKGRSEKTNVRVCPAVAKGVSDPVSGLVWLTLGKPVLHCIRNFRLYVSFGLKKNKKTKNSKLNISMTLWSPLACFYSLWVISLIFLEFSCWEEAAPDGTHNYFVK